ncbi:MAG: hypothetical protein L3K16_00885 [Thermoplasmata archaeon]|nr:hypothetical protein [Thermoplasmata archaeon]
MTMAVSLNSSDAGPIVLLILIAVIIGRRVVLMVRGTQVRPGRMFAIAAFYVALFGLTIASSFNELPVWTYVVDIAVVVAASIGATVLVQKRVVVEWKDGMWMYRLGALIPAIYLTLFVVRLALDLFVLNVNPFDFTTLPSPAPLTGTPLVIVVLVDVLFAFSTGLLVGRTLGVYLEYRKFAKAGPPPGAVPLPGAGGGPSPPAS